MCRIIFQQDRRRQGFAHVVECDPLGIHLISRMLADIDASRRLCP
jgi:hypothetical protein